jgi:hypothetical protein
MQLQPTDSLPVTLPVNVWQGLAQIVARAVSPLDVQTTAAIVSEWQMALGRAEQAAINAKAPVDPPASDPPPPPVEP